MNIQEYIDLYSGGPGSGCNPAKGHCGRPIGLFSPEHQKAIQKVLKDEAFKKARKALSKVVVKPTGGKITNKTKKEMLDKGALLFPTKKAILPDTIDQKVQKGQTKAKYQLTVNRYQQQTAKPDQLNIPLSGKNKWKATDLDKEAKATNLFKDVTVTVLKPVKPGPVAMGKNESATKMVKGILRHPMYGKFSTATDRFDEGNKKTWVFDADKSPEGHGNTLFVEHNRISAIKSEVRIQEIKRGQHNQIEDVKELQFPSGKSAKTYMHVRYGIKNFSWSGAEEKGWRAAGDKNLLAQLTAVQRMNLMQKIFHQYQQPFIVLSVKPMGGYKNVRARLKIGKVIEVRV